MGVAQPHNEDQKCEQRNANGRPFKCSPHHKTILHFAFYASYLAALRPQMPVFKVGKPLAL
jgi:hypothetical protein